MAKKMQKVVMAIWMVVVAMGISNSCTKELNIEPTGISTSWGGSKGTSSVKKDTWEEIDENFKFFIKINSDDPIECPRSIGAYGEAAKVVTVEAEEYLHNVKYVEGKLSSEEDEWESGRYWVGTQVTRTQAFRLENAKYGADYSDSWYSTDAHFEKDTLKAEFPDAQWHRSVKLDSTDVYNKSIDGQKGYYKVKDYIVTVTNTASVKSGFVKDAQKAVKPFTMKDTLSLRFYVEPDPEDEFVRRWGEVELYEDGEKIVGEWTVKEEWTISKVREVYHKALDFTAWAKGSDNSPVYPTNTAYQIVSEKWNGTGNKAIATTSSNGIKADEFKTHFEVYGDKSVTLTYEDQSVTFNAELVQEAAKQSISEATLTNISGTYYNISLYTAEILPVYTVTAGEKNAKLELSAKGETQLRVKANANVKVENQEFVAKFKAEGAKLYHEDGQYANLWDEVEYTETVETGRKNVVRPLILLGEVNGVDTYEVDDASMLGQLKLSSIKGNANSTSKKDGNFNVKTVAATVTTTFDNKKTQTIDFKVTSETTDGMTLGYAAIDFDKISCKIETELVNETTMKIVPKYTVPVVITGLDGKTETKEFVIYNPFNEVVKAKPQDKVDTVYTPSVKNGELIMLVERVVNDKDRTTIRTDKYTPNFGITAQSAKDMYGKDYATTYNGTRNVKTNTVPSGYWTVENTKGEVTSTLSNGSNSDDNIADYAFDSKITYTDGDYSYIWIGKMDLSDKTNVTDAGYKTINDVYYKVSDYQENFNGIYTINGEEFGRPSDALKRQILVKVVTTTEIENKRYEAVFETSGANLTTKVNANSWDVVTYTDGVETGRKTETHPLIVEANISGAQPFEVKDKADLNKEYKITSVTRTGNQVITITEGGIKKERTVQNFSVTVNNGQTLNVRVVTEEDLTEGMTLSHTYCESVKAKGINANVNGNTVTLTPQVNVMLVQDNGVVATKAATGEAKPYTIESSMVGTYTPETTQEYEPEVVNGRPVVHEYDVTDGVRTFKQDYPYTPNKNLTAKSAKDMYGENYSTVYNGTRNITTSTSTNGYWTVENTKGQVYSTLSNGVSSDDNIADYGYDSAMTFKKGNYSYTFVGTSTFANSTDALKDAGTKTISGITYNVSDYKENFNMVYTIDGTTIDNLSDAVKRQILVEVEIEDLVPGTILAVNVRAVAAVWNGSKYVNADGHLDKIKGLAIVTKEHKGAYIPFAAANAQVALPSDEDIKNANYVERDYYNSDYVAGYDTNKNGNWQLATVEDRSNQIVYFDNGTAVRSLTQKSMNTWGWASGEQTSQVGGYKIEVKDGVCTVYFNDKLVKIFK